MSRFDDPFEKFRRLQRSLSRATNFPALDHIMSRAHGLSLLSQQFSRTPSLNLLIRDMERVRNLVSLDRNLGAMFQFRSEFASAVNAARITSSHFDGVAARMAGNNQRIGELFRLNRSPALKSSMLIFEGLIESRGVLGVGSTLSMAMDSLRVAADDPSPDNTMDFLGHLEKGVAEALDHGPEEAHLKLTVLSVLISIVLFVLSVGHSEYRYRASTDVSAEFDVRVMQQFEFLTEQLDELQSTDQPELTSEFYLVERQVPLTQKPRRHSTVLRWLQSGELVWVIGRSRKWVQVHYVDSIDGSVQDGWVKKKYLKR